MTCPDPYLTTSIPCEPPPTLGPPVSYTNTTVPRELPADSLPLTGFDAVSLFVLGAIAVAAGLAARRARHGER